MSLSLFTSLESIATNTNRKINSIADMNLSSLTPLYNNTTSSLTGITFGPGSSSYFSIDSNIDFNKNDEYINFDWEMYLQFYEDLQHKTNDKSVAWEHWDKHGKKENTEENFTQ